MRRYPFDFVLILLLATVGVTWAQFKSPDQRAKQGSVRLNNVTASTVQTGNAIPSSLVGLAGSGSLMGCQEGTGPTTGLANWDLWWCDSTYHGLKANLNNTGNQYIPFLSSLPTTNGQTPTFTTSGVFSAWQGMQAFIGWDGALGTYLTTARKAATATNPGHFTSLMATAVLTGACTTNPEFNVVDITQTTAGNPTTGLTTTVATVVSAGQTLTFNAGDTIGISVSTAGATCTAPAYSVTATITQP